MTDKAATNPAAITPVADNANTDVPSRTLGKLAGRRISMVGNELHMPNTTQGRALAVLLTGQPSSKSQNGSLVLDCCTIRSVAGLIELLTSVSLAIQKEPDTPAEISPVLQLLLEFQLDRKEALKRAADPWVTIERVTDWQSYLACFGDNFTNPAGMLNARLRDHIEAPYNPSRQQPALEQQQEAQQDFSDDYDYEIPPPQPINLRLSEPAAPTGRSPASIWQTVCGELQLQLPRETFDTWLRHARLVDYDPATTTYTVGVQNTYAQEWLEHRLRNMIKRTLSQVAESTVEVHFVVSKGEVPGAFS